MMKSDRLVSLGLALLVLVLYVGVLGHDFVIYDDPGFVSQNRHVLTGISVDNTLWAFSTTDEANWIPVTWLSFMLDVELFGGKATGFLVTNVLLHAANTVLLFGFLRRLTGLFWPSAFVAALFGVHPQHVESVAWITERKDVLSMFFGLLSLIAYERYARCGTKRRTKWYLASLAGFALSLMAKQTFVTLPVLLIVLDWWPLQRLGRSNSTELETNVTKASKPKKSGKVAARAQSQTIEPTLPPCSLQRILLEKLPFLGLSAVFCVIVIAAQGAAVATVEVLPLYERFANAICVYVIYLRQMVWPIGLAVIYPHPQAGVATAYVVGAAAFLVVVTAVAFAARRRFPFLLPGWLWYVGTLVPMIGIVQVGTQRMADRYTYLPLIGIYIAVAYTLTAAVSAKSRRWLAAAAIGVVCVSCGLTWRQIGYWQNSVSLFSHAIAVTDNNSVAHVNLGHAMFATGRLNDAVSQFREVLEFDPDYTEAHYNLAATLKRLGQAQDAETHYRQTIALSPRHFRAHLGLGVLLQELGRLDEAERHLRRALEIAPESARATNNLGKVLAMRKQWVEAREQFEQALKYDPDFTEASYNLGILLAEQGRVLEAIVQFEQLIRADPEDNDSRNQLARLHRRLGMEHAEKGQSSAAIAQFREALKWQSRSARTHYLLGSELLRAGELSSAAKHFSAAVTLRPQFAEGHHQLGRVLWRLNEPVLAIRHLRAAVRLQPDFPAAEADLRRALEGEKTRP